MTVSSSTRPSVTHPQPIILVVDDDADIVLAVHDLLEHAGYRVMVAGTGAEAVSKAKSESFAAVLLDMMLPDMDGLSVLTLLKKIDPTLPVIMLTAFVEVAKKFGSLTEGAFGYLTKPYDADELKALVKRAVEAKHLSTEAAAVKLALTASEQRFREVVQTAPDAIILSDGDGLILSWNNAAERLFGYAADEVVGRHLTMLMPERYRAAHQRALQRLRETGEFRLRGKIVTMHGLHKDGREFPIEMSLSSWVSEGTRFHCGIVRDVTAWKEAEAKLLHQQIEQQVLLDLIPAMVWYKDPHNRILRANRRAAESINRTVAEVEGRQTAEFYPEEADKYHCDDLEVIASRQPKLGIVELYRDGSGEKRWVQTDKVPYCDPQGNVLGVLVFAQDITERKRTEEALRESEERLRVMVDASLHGMVMVDAAGIMLLMNREFARQFGYDRYELLGQSIGRLVPERFRSLQSDDGPAWLSRPGTGPSTTRRNVVGLRKDGSEFGLTISLSSLTTKDGAYVITSVSDIP
ncbi:MAG TPA: PAS domain S-box protein [Nitrospiraceae bacterium]|nr:PAS domain S-box protein [Nitrospiraceae bacterium]